jgi:3',5'-cyclic AMP phosphodiesterase CpdA
MRAPGHAAHEQVVAGIVRERPMLVLNTGDLVATGSEESAWQKYFEITARMGAIAPVVPAFGNHEAYRLGLGLAKAWSLFGLTSVTPAPGYTAFDWGGAHFIVLDSNHLEKAQRDWLAADLTAARQRHVRAIFTVCHDGPWSHGVHGGSRAMQTDFAPLLAAAGVDFLFGGHDHLYERGIGMTSRGPLAYAVVGGGGAPLYNPSCRVGRADGDALTLPRCPSSVADIAKTHHYVLVEVGAHTVRLCAKLPDGSPLGPCVETKLKQKEGNAP